MFSGIIEAIGNIECVQNIGTDKKFVFDPKLLDLQDLQPGDSISVNGVCLSITELHEKNIITDVSLATLGCTTFSHLAVGDHVNLEKALQLSARLNGHIVSGHIDGMGVIEKKYAEARSQCFEISFPAELKPYICKKGSICVDGVSLTINSVSGLILTTNIIPYTQLKTIFFQYTTGTQVNLEVDMIARYVESLMVNGRERI